MKKLSVVLMMLTVSSLAALAACGGHHLNTVTSGAQATNCTASQTVTLEVSTFQNNGGCVEVKVGQPVTFDDTGNGGATHIICTGPTNGAYSATCVPNPNAPAQLAGATGMMLKPGSHPQITLSHVGIYNIVCTVHPNMRITIKAQ